MARALLRIDPADDVAVALRDIAPGETLDGVTALEAIPKGHKIALHDVAVGAAVHKYGWPIGKASTAIAAGSHVHSHNLATALSGEEGYAPPTTYAAPAITNPAPGFMGYRRADGRV